MTTRGDKPKSDQLGDFERRLDKTLQEQKKAAGPDTTEGSAAGLAMRAVTELFVGLAVCMALGYFADKYLGTAPWIMLALMPFGLAGCGGGERHASRQLEASEQSSRRRWPGGAFRQR